MKNLTLNLEEIEASGIPKAFWKLGIDTYQGDKEALRRSNDLIKKDKKFLADGSQVFLVGPENSFKTFLLCHVLKSLMVKGYSCVYSRMDDAIALHYNSQDPYAFHRLYGNVDFVAIDNIDETTRTEAPRVVMTRMIKLRKDEGLPLLIASSLLQEDTILEQYGKELRTFAREALQIHTIPTLKEQMVFRYDSGDAENFRE